MFGTSAWSARVWTPAVAGGSADAQTAEKKSSALLHQKSYPAVCSTGGQEILVAFSAGEVSAGDRPRITSSCHCSSKGCEPLGLYFSHSSLKGADVQGLIAFGESLGTRCGILLPDRGRSPS